MNEQQETNKAIFFKLDLVTGIVSETDKYELIAFEVFIERKPKEACYRCYGRGWKWILIENQLKVPCQCVGKCTRPNNAIKQNKEEDTSNVAS